MTRAALFLTVAVLAGCAVQAPPTPTTSMLDQPYITLRPTISRWLDFLERHPDQYAERAEVVSLTPETWRLLDRINRQVNKAPYVSDLPVVGVSYTTEQAAGFDRWTLLEGGAGGDCEDFALTKRKLLADAGLPIGALRLALAALPDGMAHAVLVVVSDQGDYVLDNNSNAIVPWDAARMTWILRHFKGSEWHAFTLVRSNS